MDALTELCARVQILDALARYARGADRLDLDLVLSAFHPGAIDHHGKNVGDPREIFPLIFERIRAQVAATHQLGSSCIVFTNETSAAVETYALAFHRIRNDAELLDLQIGLRYVDSFALRDGEWRISERHVVEDWRRADPVTTDAPPSAFEAGRRDQSDRSYAIGF